MLLGLLFKKQNINVGDSIGSGSQTDSFAKSGKGQFNLTVEEQKERGKQLNQKSVVTWNYQKLHLCPFQSLSERWDHMQFPNKSNAVCTEFRTPCEVSVVDSETATQIPL